jgi:aminobenzoyl-glutamate utilization protein B
VAAKAMALTAVTLFQDQTIVLEATAEFQRRRGNDFQYEALLGDREPPLNYRRKQPNAIIATQLQ